MPTAPIIHGLHAPARAASAAGSANTAPPITWLTPMAVRSQRPSNRRRAGRICGASSRVGSGTGWLYHGRAPSREHPARPGPRFPKMADADIIIKPRDVMPAGAFTLPAAYYTDPSYFRTEMDRLFAR